MLWIATEGEVGILWSGNSRTSRAPLGNVVLP